MATRSRRLLRGIAVACGFLAASLTAPSAMADHGQGFRLAGVVAAGHDYLGVLELPSGEQMLIRRGDAVPEGGRVESIESRAVRVRFPSGSVELRLDGSRQRISVATAGVVQESLDSGNIHVVKVDADLLQKGLAGHDDLPADPTAANTQRRGRKDVGAELGRRFAAVLDLPADARVLAVNERPVTSAETAMRAINSGLERGLPVRLNLANASGPQHRVYLLPSTAQQRPH